jgi:hypothetical protein
MAFPAASCPMRGAAAALERRQLPQAGPPRSVVLPCRRRGERRRSRRMSRPAWGEPGSGTQGTGALPLKQRKKKNIALVLRPCKKFIKHPPHTKNANNKLINVSQSLYDVSHPERNKERQHKI